MKHVDALWWAKCWVLNVRACGTYSYHYALKSWNTSVVLSISSSNQPGEVNQVPRMRLARNVGRMPYTKFWSEYLKHGDHLSDYGLDERVISKLILERRCWRYGQWRATRTWKWTSGFQKYGHCIEHSAYRITACCVGGDELLGAFSDINLCLGCASICIDRDTGGICLWVRKVSALEHRREAAAGWLSCAPVPTHAGPLGLCCLSRPNPLHDTGNYRYRLSTSVWSGFKWFWLQIAIIAPAQTGGKKTQCAHCEVRTRVLNTTYIYLDEFQAWTWV